MNSLPPQTRVETDLTPHGRRSWRSLPVGLTLLAFSLVLGSCSAIGGSGSPVKTVTKGDELAYYDFSSPGTFEEGAYGDGKARLEVRDGAYHMDLSLGDGTLWYGQWGDSLRDTVTDVDTNESTDSPNVTYGVMCRARGTVGQVPSKNDSDLTTLAAEANTALLPSTSLVLPDATTAPTANPPTATAASTTEATAASTSETTSEATASSTAEATHQATSEATAAVTEAVTAEATTAPTAEVTAQATAETTSAATPEIAPTPDSTSVNNGDGYLFLIQGSGKFAIMKSSGRKVTPLVDWTASGSIKTGAAQNHIRVICMGNYLAMYVNGDFMADASDDTYNVGQVGLVAASADQLGNQVAFDNLTISEAKAG